MGRAAVPRATVPPVAVLFTALALALAAGACAQTAAGGTSDVAGALPFEAGEGFVYSLHNAEGEELGGGALITEQGDDGTLRLMQRYWRPTGEIVDETGVTVDAATMKPHGGRRVIDPGAAEGSDGEREVRAYEWSYDTEVEDGEEQARLHVTRVLREGGPDGAERERDEQTVRLREHFYDNESSLWLWRTLAFEEEYEERYVSANAIEANQTTVDISIPMRQTVELPAGTFDTWRILVRTGRAVRTAWVNAEAPHQVVQWDNGDVIFRLERTTTAEDAAPPAP